MSLIGTKLMKPTISAIRPNNVNSLVIFIFSVPFPSTFFYWIIFLLFFFFQFQTIGSDSDGRFTSLVIIFKSY